MAEQPDDRRPTLFRPGTFARHDDAVRYVEQYTRTRHPRRGNARGLGLAPGAWGLLPDGSTIAGASGTDLGTGDVQLCDREGNVLEDVGVEVYNAGNPITASGSDKVVALEWVQGDWTVCGCQPRGCSWFGTGSPPANLYWTDPFIGTKTLVLKNPSGIDCYWQWCGTWDMPATETCGAVSGVNLSITLSRVGMDPDWTVRYAWQQAGGGILCGLGLVVCPGVGSAAETCDNWGAHTQTISGVGTGGWFHAIFSSRPYSQVWSIAAVPYTQSYSKLVGQAGCGSTGYPATWSITE